MTDTRAANCPIAETLARQRASRSVGSGTGWRRGFRPISEVPHDWIGEQDVFLLRPIADVVNDLVATRSGNKRVDDETGVVEPPDAPHDDVAREVIRSGLRDWRREP